IWNFVADLLPSREVMTTNSDDAIRQIARDVLRVPTQRIDSSAPVWWLMTRVETMSWSEVYDLLEYVVRGAPAWRPVRRERVVSAANALLEQEHSGYRFINRQLAPITNAAEISEVEAAVKMAGGAGLDGVRQQLEQAVKLFGRRPAPDYANAIKEAVSAV